MTSKSKQPTRASLPVPANKLVPHRHRMLFLQTLDQFAEGKGQAYLTVKRDNLFARKDSLLDPIVLVEFLAQLIAAHSGYNSLTSDAPRKNGFLVGIKDFEIAQTVRVGDVLNLQITKEYDFDQINYVNGIIKKGDTDVAGGTLKLWEYEGDLPDEDRPTLSQSLSSSFSFGTLAKDRMLALSELNEAIGQAIVDWQASDDQHSCRCELLFDERFPGFDGHFPGAPLLPGVVMLKIGVLMAELLLEKSLALKKIKHAKFARSIYPHESFESRINIQTGNEGFGIQAQIVKGDTLCAKFSFIVELKKHCETNP